jgi:hypothetical protein
VESALSLDPNAASCEVLAAQPEELLAERWDPRRRRRDLLRRWQAAIPFWLCSLILHLVSFLLIASLSCPWTGSRGPSASRGISLVVSFGADQRSRGQESVVLPASGDVLDPSPTRGAAEEEELPRIAQQASTEDVSPVEQRPPSPPSQSAESAAQRPTPSTLQRWMQTAMADPNFGKAPSRYAALLNRNRPTVPPPPVARTPVLSLTNSTEFSTSESDRIVDDFIAYDTGQLRGRAGQQAHRRFMAMGPEGIPAVVRGLNKAAQINASCPVGVLAGKLINLLHAIRDPSLNQYAIDNLGRDVPATAPHYQRLIALRDRWLGQAVAEKQSISQLVARHGLEQDGEFVELVLALTDAPAETILASLQTTDVKLRGAALLALIQSRYPLSEHPRRAIVRELLKLTSDNSAGSHQSLARSALQSVRQSSAP